MNTIKIKTKQAVNVNPASNLSAVVYLEIINKVHHFEDDSYEFGIRYYYEITHNEGEENEYVEQIVVPFKGRGRSLTKEEVDAVAANITPTGETYTQVERSYTLAGAFAIVQADSAENWGLTANDWEVAN